MKSLPFFYLLHLSNIYHLHDYLFQKECIIQLPLLNYSSFTQLSCNSQNTQILIDIRNNQNTKDLNDAFYFQVIYYTRYYIREMQDQNHQQQISLSAIVQSIYSEAQFKMHRNRISGQITNLSEDSQVLITTCNHILNNFELLCNYKYGIRTHPIGSRQQKLEKLKNMIKSSIQNINKQKNKFHNGKGAANFRQRIDNCISIVQTTKILYQIYLMERLLQAKEYMNISVIEEQLKKISKLTSESQFCKSFDKELSYLTRKFSLKILVDKRKTRLLINLLGEVKIQGEIRLNLAFTLRNLINNGCSIFQKQDLQNLGEIALNARPQIVKPIGQMLIVLDNKNSYNLTFLNRLKSQKNQEKNFKFLLSQSFKLNLGEGIRANSYLVPSRMIQKRKQKNRVIHIPRQFNCQQQQFKQKTQISQIQINSNLEKTAKAPLITDVDEAGSDLSKFSTTYQNISNLYNRVISDLELKKDDKDIYLIQKLIYRKDRWFVDCELGHYLIDKMIIRIYKKLASKQKLIAPTINQLLKFAFMGSQQFFKRYFLKSESQIIEIYSKSSVKYQENYKQIQPADALFINTILNKLISSKTISNREKIKWLKGDIDLLRIEAAEAVYQSLDRIQSLINSKEEEILLRYFNTLSYKNDIDSKFLQIAFKLQLLYQSRFISLKKQRLPLMLRLCLKELKDIEKQSNRQFCLDFLQTYIQKYQNPKDFSEKELVDKISFVDQLLQISFNQPQLSRVQKIFKIILGYFINKDLKPINFQLDLLSHKNFDRLYNQILCICYWNIKKSKIEGISNQFINSLVNKFLSQEYRTNNEIKHIILILIEQIYSKNCQIKFDPHHLLEFMHDNTLVQIKFDKFHFQQSNVIDGNDLTISLIAFRAIRNICSSLKYSYQITQSLQSSLISSLDSHQQSKIQITSEFFKEYSKLYIINNININSLEEYFSRFSESISTVQLNFMKAGLNQFQMRLDKNIQISQLDLELLQKCFIADCQSQTQEVKDQNKKVIELLKRYLQKKQSQLNFERLSEDGEKIVLFCLQQMDWKHLNLKSKQQQQKITDLSFATGLYLLQKYTRRYGINKDISIRLCKLYEYQNIKQHLIFGQKINTIYNNLISNGNEITIEQVQIWIKQFTDCRNKQQALTIFDRLDKVSKIQDLPSQIFNIIQCQRCCKFAYQKINLNYMFQDEINKQQMEDKIIELTQKGIQINLYASFSDSYRNIGINSLHNIRILCNLAEKQYKIPYHIINKLLAIYNPRQNTSRVYELIAKIIALTYRNYSVLQILEEDKLKQSIYDQRLLEIVSYVLIDRANKYPDKQTIIKMLEFVNKNRANVSLRKAISKWFANPDLVNIVLNCRQGNNYNLLQFLSFKQQDSRQLQKINKEDLINLSQYEYNQDAKQMLSKSLRNYCQISQIIIDKQDNSVNLKGIQIKQAQVQWVFYCSGAIQQFSTDTHQIFNSCFKLASNLNCKHQIKQNGVIKPDRCFYVNDLKAVKQFFEKIIEEQKFENLQKINDDVQQRVFIQKEEAQKAYIRSVFLIFKQCEHFSYSQNLQMIMLNDYFIKVIQRSIIGDKASQQWLQLLEIVSRKGRLKNYKQSLIKMVQKITSSSNNKFIFQVLNLFTAFSTNSIQYAEIHNIFKNDKQKQWLEKLTKTTINLPIIHENFFAHRFTKMVENKRRDIKLEGDYLISLLTEKGTYKADNYNYNQIEEQLLNILMKQIEENEIKMIHFKLFWTQNLINSSSFLQNQRVQFLIQTILFIQDNVSLQIISDFIRSFLINPFLISSSQQSEQKRIKNIICSIKYDRFDIKIMKKKLFNQYIQKEKSLSNNRNQLLNLSVNNPFHIFMNLLNCLMKQTKINKEQFLQKIGKDNIIDRYFFQSQTTKHPQLIVFIINIIGALQNHNVIVRQNALDKFIDYISRIIKDSPNQSKLVVDNIKKIIQYFLTLIKQEPQKQQILQQLLIILTSFSIDHIKTLKLPQIQGIIQKHSQKVYAFLKQINKKQIQTEQHSLRYNNTESKIIDSVINKVKTDQNFQAWLRNIKENKPKIDQKFLSQVLRFISIKCDAETGKKVRLRKNQIYACIKILNNYQIYRQNRAIKNNLLLQISTGEGKSTVICVIAIVLALLGQKVDIITTTSILAKRDADEFRKIYNAFQVTVDNNNDTQQYIDGKKVCYDCDVVYGEVGQFQFDYLRVHYNGYNTKCGRSQSIVIVDEVDSMLIDDGSKIAKISSSIVGMEKIQYIYLLIWESLFKIKENCLEIDDQKYYLQGTLEANLEQQKITFKYEEQIIVNDQKQIKKHEINDIIKFIKDKYDSSKYKKIRKVNNFDEVIRLQLKECGKKIKQQQQRNIPKHLREFYLQQFDRWLESAIRANQMNENIHYVIDNNTINPVSYDSTGKVQYSNCWGQGLHQFLQLKHFLEISGENLTTNFISNIKYFQKYKHLIGLTGTLGSQACQESLKNNYHAKIQLISDNFKKKITELPPKLCFNQAQWRQNLYESIKIELKKGKGVLMICQNIAECQLHETYLQKRYDKVKSYTKNDKNQEKNIQKIESGQIIISTNLAGRGTHIDTSQINKYGGLHVIITFLPKNLRVQMQALGRTARMGNPGSFQIIINKQILYEYSQSMNYQQIINKRDQKELNDLRQFSDKQLKVINLKDELFQIFCQQWKQLKETIKKTIQSKQIRDGLPVIGYKFSSKIIHDYILRSVEERWAFFFNRLDNYKLGQDNNFLVIDSNKVNLLGEKAEKLELIKNKCFPKDPSSQQSCIDHINNPFYLCKIGFSYLQHITITQYFSKDHLDKAYFYFQQAIKTDSNTISPYLGLAQLFISQFDKKKIRELQNKQLPIPQNSLHNYKLLAIYELYLAKKLIQQQNNRLSRIFQYSKLGHDQRGSLHQQLNRKYTLNMSIFQRIVNNINIIKASRKPLKITARNRKQGKKTDCIRFSNLKCTTGTLQQLLIKQIEEDSSIQMSFTSLNSNLQDKSSTIFDYIQSLEGNQFKNRLTTSLLLIKLSKSEISTFLLGCEYVQKLKKKQIMKKIKKIQQDETVPAKIYLNNISQSFSVRQSLSFIQNQEQSDEHFSYTYYSPNNAIQSEMSMIKSINLIIKNVNQDIVNQLVEIFKEQIKIQIILSRQELKSIVKEQWIRQQAISIKVVDKKSLDQQQSPLCYQSMKWSQLIISPDQNYLALPKELYVEFSIKNTKLLQKLKFQKSNFKVIFMNIDIKNLNPETIFKLPDLTIKLQILGLAYQDSKQLIKLLLKAKKQLQYNLTLNNLSLQDIINHINLFNIDEEQVRIQERLPLSKNYGFFKYKMELYQLYLEGFEYEIVVKQIKSLPIKTLFGLGALAIAQVLGGFILLQTPLFFIGQGLIFEALVDIGTIWNVYRSRQFNWKVYLLLKSASIVAGYFFGEMAAGAVYALTNVLKAMNGVRFALQFYIRIKLAVRFKEVGLVIAKQFQQQNFDSRSLKQKENFQYEKILTLCLEQKISKKLKERKNMLNMIRKIFILDSLQNNQIFANTFTFKCKHILQKKIDNEFIQLWMRLIQQLSNLLQTSVENNDQISKELRNITELQFIICDICEEMQFQLSKQEQRCLQWTTIKQKFKDWTQPKQINEKIVNNFIVQETITIRTQKKKYRTFILCDRFLEELQLDENTKKSWTFYTRMKEHLQKNPTQGVKMKFAKLIAKCFANEIIQAIIKKRGINIQRSFHNPSNSFAFNLNNDGLSDSQIKNLIDRDQKYLSQLDQFSKDKYSLFAESKFATPVDIIILAEQYKIDVIIIQKRKNFQAKKNHKYLLYAKNQARGYYNFELNPARNDIGNKSLQDEGFYEICDLLNHKIKTKQLRANYAEIVYKNWEKFCKYSKIFNKLHKFTRDNPMQSHDQILCSISIAPNNGYLSFAELIKRAQRSNPLQSIIELENQVKCIKQHIKVNKINQKSNEYQCIFNLTYQKNGEHDYLFKQFIISNQGDRNIQIYYADKNKAQTLATEENLHLLKEKQLEKIIVQTLLNFKAR